MFIQTKVFDPSLEGKAVKFFGGLEGNFIISRVHSYSIEVVGRGTASVAFATTLKMSQFETEVIKMVILEEPEEKEVVELPDDLPDGVEIAEKHGKVFRSAQQIRIDNAHVEGILKADGFPMPIAEIVDAMKVVHGHHHWRKDNASSFLKVAIAAGKKIKRADRGLYSYDWEASE